MAAMYRLVLRMQVTRARAAGLLALGAISIILAITIHADNSGASFSNTQDIFEVIDDLGIGVLAPVAALVLASAALGDLTEDRTLVYVWMRPVERTKVVLGALAATLTVTLPFVVLPLAAATIVGGAGSDLLWPTLVGATLAVLGYTALFLALGLRVRRALVWGLAYVVIWEGAVARAAKGAARLSVQVYARSALAHLGDQPLPKQAASVAVAVVVIALVAVAGYVVTVRWLDRAEVA